MKRPLLLIIALLAMTLPAWSIFTPVADNLYPDNMTMVIQLTNGSETIDTCEVASFIDGECRSATRAIKGLYYLIIPGEGGGQKLEIRTCLKGEIVTIDQSLVYGNNLIIGTPWEPYIINISDAIGGNRRKGDVNGDGAVDVADIAGIIAVMSRTMDSQGGTTPNPADVNGDGTVDVADIATVISIMASKP